jgi:hypothetical protein
MPLTIVSDAKSLAQEVGEGSVLLSRRSDPRCSYLVRGRAAVVGFGFVLNEDRRDVSLSELIEGRARATYVQDPSDCVRDHPSGFPSDALPREASLRCR